MQPKPHESLGQVLTPLFEVLPLNKAMHRLVVGGGSSEHVGLIERLIEDADLRDRPELCAGLWLYADELDRSHTISQRIETPTGSFWHAIMHRREGDFSNSHYWYRRAGKHPAMNLINSAGGGAGGGTAVAAYDPHHFIDRVERCVADRKSDCPELIALQRREWLKLFEWCAEHD
jgi:hypothetical protein